MHHIHDFRQVLGNYYQAEMQNPSTTLCSYLAGTATMLVVVLYIPPLCAPSMKPEVTIQDLTCALGTTLLALGSGYGSSQLTHMISRWYFG